MDTPTPLHDIGGGKKIPRKGGLGLTQSDLFVINKTDLATRDGLEAAVSFIETRGLLTARATQPA